jgi:hypothetical protein
VVLAGQDLPDPLAALLFQKDDMMTRKRTKKISALMILSQRMMKKTMRKKKNPGSLADLRLGKVVNHLALLPGKKHPARAAGMRKTTTMIMIDLGGHLVEESRLEVDLLHDVGHLVDVDLSFHTPGIRNLPHLQEVLKRSRVPCLIQLPSEMQLLTR